MDPVSKQLSLQDNDSLQQIQYEGGDFVVCNMLKKLTKYLAASFLNVNAAGGTAADSLCGIIAKQFYLNEQKESEKQNLTIQLQRVLEQYLQTKQLLSDAEELNQTIKHDLQSCRDELKDNSNNNIHELEDNYTDRGTSFLNCQTEMHVQKERPEVQRSDEAEKLEVCDKDSCDEHKELDLKSHFSEAKINCLQKMDQFCEYLEELWVGDENVIRSRIISSQLRFARPSHAKFAIQHYLCQILFAEFEKEDLNVNSGCCMFFDTKDLAKAAFEEYKHYSSAKLEDLAAEVIFNRGKSFSKFYWDKLTTAYLAEETLRLSSKDSIGTFTQDKILTGFLEISQAVWALHKLTFSFQPPARIMRFKKSSDYNATYMESLLGEGNPDFLPRVGLITMPAFQVNDVIVGKSIIYPEGKKHSSGWFS